LPSQPEPLTVVEPAPSPPSSSQIAMVVAAHPQPQPEPAPLEQIEWAKELEPRGIADAKRLAQAVFDSKLFAAYGNTQAAFLIIMAGREFGLGAMASLRSFHIVEGRPCLSAQAMMGLCLRHSSCEYFMVTERSNNTARVIAKRKDWPGPCESTFTIEDAQRAGLTGRQNWRKYPRAMLTNRAIAEAARFWFPDVVGGLYDPDELAA